MANIQMENATSSHFFQLPSYSSLCKHPHLPVIAVFFSSCSLSFLSHLLFSFTSHHLVRCNRQVTAALAASPFSTHLWPLLRGCLNVSMHLLLEGYSSVHGKAELWKLQFWIEAAVLACTLDARMKSIKKKRIRKLDKVMLPERWGGEFSRTESPVAGTRFKRLSAALNTTAFFFITALCTYWCLVGSYFSTV